MAVLKRIVIQNFRNYEAIDVSFAKGVNVLVGQNGQGKTNLLEAIYFLSILRSFRCSQLRNLYRWRQPLFLIRGEVESASRTSSIGIEYSQKRRLRIDGETINKASDFIGRLYTVAFVPEDIELVKGTAADRRRFLDITLTQLLPQYLPLLQSYDKALKSRNALLRREQQDWAAIEAFDRVLIQYGTELIAHRLRFFAEFKNYLQRAADALLPENSEFSLRYQSLSGLAEDAERNAIAEALSNALRQNRDRDAFRGMTNAGPHRDDFSLHLAGRNLSSYGSEGQCRLAALILKSAKADYLFDQKDEDEIILLVDDVIGELDERGCKAFYRSLERADQVFVACTEAEKLHDLCHEKLFVIEDGKLLEQS